MTMVISPSHQARMAVITAIPRQWHCQADMQLLTQDQRWPSTGVRGTPVAARILASSTALPPSSMSSQYPHLVHGQTPVLARLRIPSRAAAGAQRARDGDQPLSHSIPTRPIHPISSHPIPAQPISRFAGCCIVKPLAQPHVFVRSAWRCTGGGGVSAGGVRGIMSVARCRCGHLLHSFGAALAAAEAAHRSAPWPLGLVIRALALTLSLAALLLHAASRASPWTLWTL